MSEHVHRIASFEEASRLNYFRDGPGREGVVWWGVELGSGRGRGWRGKGDIEKMIKK